MDLLKINRLLEVKKTRGRNNISASCFFIDFEEFDFLQMLFVFAGNNFAAQNQVTIKG